MQNNPNYLQDGKLMVKSGVGDLEVAITAGSQKVLNSMHMGFKLEHLYDGCRHLKDAGFNGRVILNYSLNSPDETEETLLQSTVPSLLCFFREACEVLFTSDRPQPVTSITTYVVLY